jgi:hypothetical protein
MLPPLAVFVGGGRKRKLLQSRSPAAAIGYPRVNVGLQESPAATEPKAGNISAAGEVVGGGVMAIEIVGEVPESQHRRFGARP